MRLVAPVEVAAAAGYKVQLLGQLRELLAVVRVVARVVDFNAGESGVFPATERAPEGAHAAQLHLAWVRNDAHAARVVRRADGVLGGGDFRLHVGRAVVAQESLERLAQVLHHTLLDERVGDVGTRHDAADRVLGDVFVGDVDAQAVQLHDDGRVALVARNANAFQKRVERLVSGIHAVHQHVHDACRQLRRDFAAVEDFDAQSLARFAGLGQRRHRVVVGDRERVQADFCRQLDQRRGARVPSECVVWACRSIRG